MHVSDPRVLSDHHGEGGVLRRSEAGFVGHIQRAGRTSAPRFDQGIVRGTEAVAGALRYGRETVDAVFIDPGAGAGVLHPGIAGRAALNQGHLPAAALLFTQLGVHAGGKEGFLWKPCNILMITGIPWRTLQSWFHYNRYFQFVHLNYICICRIQAEVSRLQLYAGKRM